MALYIPFRRCVYQYVKRNINTGIIHLRNNKFHGRILTLEEDSLDDFTTQLLQKKIEKWSCRKTVSNVSLNVVPENDSKDNISGLNNDKVDKLFQEAIENNNNCQVLELIEQCIYYKICPSLPNILYSLEICSQSGNLTIIKSIESLCKELCPENLILHSNFQHYVAETFWIKGNTNEALRLFKEVYKENIYLRRRIRLILKNLIVNLVTSRSEAVLVNITNFAEDLAIEYKDYYPLTLIWQTCFLSEWFTDQTLALNLLNKYNELRKSVTNRIPFVVAVSLNNHRTDIVYRLLEILLKFDMKLQYTGVLLALLDYQIHQKNIRRCVEIVRWSERNEIELLPIHYKNYLKLLINFKDDNSIVKKKISKTKTSFKF